MYIFYSSVPINEKEISLDKEESRHLSKVLRLTRGAVVLVTDGLGKIFEAEVISTDPSVATLKVIQEKFLYPGREFFIHIALAPTKNADRYEWFLEKAVELGVEEISFIRTERTERKSINLDRLEKIAVSALKQSIKAQKPILNDLTDFKKFLEVPFSGKKYMGHLEENSPFLNNAAEKGQSYLVLIGPEGDFTTKEVTMAKESGFIPVKLGDYRLRTETAALAACHILNIINY